MLLRLVKNSNSALLHKYFTNIHQEGVTCSKNRRQPLHKKSFVVSASLDGLLTTFCDDSLTGLRFSLVLRS